MAIHYRRAGESSRVHREGTVETVAELEALVSIGTLHATDEVALDGARFQEAKQIPQLRGAFSEINAASAAWMGDALLVAAIAVLGLSAVGFVFHIAALAVKLALLAGAGFGAVWLFQKIFRPSAD